MLIKIDNKLLGDTEKFVHLFHNNFGVTQPHLLWSSYIASCLLAFGTFDPLACLFRAWLHFNLTCRLGKDLEGGLSQLESGCRNSNELGGRLQRLLVSLVLTIVFTTLYIPNWGQESVWIISADLMMFLQHYLIAVTPPPPGSESGKVWKKINTIFLQPASQETTQ